MQRTLFSTKLTIRYCPNVVSFSWCDGDTETQARACIERFEKANTDMTVNVANELSILAFRVLVKEGRISHERIMFEHEGQQYPVNKDGRFINKRMCNVAFQLFERIF